MARMVAGLAALGLMASGAMAAGPLAKDVVLAIHGGTAGKADRDEVSDERLRAEMTKALAAGYAALQKPSATGLDGVEAAIRVLEDSPYFNAGKGAVFTHEGRNELDASIMEGKSLKAGAVASVTIIKNPITAARAVMEKTRHVLLVSRGAEVFASKLGLEIVDPSYFWTEPRWKEIQKVWEREQKREEKRAARRGKAADAGEVGGKDNSVVLNADEAEDDAEEQRPPHRWGTVGAIALDAAGNLAAGTSTGGLNNKMFGRVGDSPIIGAGTYADNQGCAVSGTGQGEYFIRLGVAHEINALMKYQKQPLETAADTVIKGKLKDMGGEGGAIALDAQGNFAAPYNTEGMHRGYVTRDGKTHVLLYSEQHRDLPAIVVFLSHETSMAISAIHRFIIRSLSENGLLPRGGALLELGEANWYTDSSPLELLGDIQQHVADPARRTLLTARLHELVERCATDEMALFEVVKIYYEVFFGPEDIQSIDFDGTATSQKLDLNAPITLNRRFNVVINHGTAEHVFNIAQVFRTMHEYTLPGGLMIHESPFHGWIDHGFFTLQPTLYFDLAEANHYRLLGMFIADFKANTICQVRARDEVHELVRNGQIPANAELMVVLKQSDEDRPFRIPWQGYYRKALTDAGMEAWRQVR